jgi:hypothetical protein
MDNAYARARRILTIAALLSVACPLFARPLLVPPKQRLTLPRLVQETYPGEWPTAYGAAAIDGDTLLTHAIRYSDNQGNRTEGVYLFQRAANGTWSYVKPLVEGVTGYPLVNGNLATVQTYGQVLVFERGTAGWTQTAVITFAQPNDFVFRLDDGAIYVEPRKAWNETGCNRPFEQWRKVGGTWQRVATIGPERCDVRNLADVNDGRALSFAGPTSSNPYPPPADVFTQSTPGWSLAGNLPALPTSPYAYAYGPYATLSGNTAYADHGFLFRDSGGNNWVSAGRLVEPEMELQPGSSNGKLRGTSLYLEGQEYDYEIASHDEDYPTSWRTVRLYRPRTNGYFDYYARLSADFDVYGWSVSEDGTRAAAVSGPDNYGISDPTILQVFEIPATATFPGTQQDNFESGNFSKWTATVGQFSVQQTTVSRVLRQSSLAGDSKAWLTAVDWTDQAIEADIRPTEFNGTDRWFGLAARRTDDRNYYYVTFREPSTISLRRMKNGVVTVLANGFTREPFVPEKSYRVRLEAIGDQVAVFLNGFPVTHAKDSSFTHGQPGLVSYRASYDADNVIVSSGTRLLVRFDSYKRRWLPLPPNGPGSNWQYVTEPSEDVNEHGEYMSYVVRQGDISGDAKWFSRFDLGNQVVSARVRPLVYGASTSTSNPWVGIAAHVVDDNNYYYLTLRNSHVISLRRMVNGKVQVIANVHQSAYPNFWYDLRLEIIGHDIRAYVNGELKISYRDSTMTGGGGNGILMFHTAADFYHYIAYQP